LKSYVLRQLFYILFLIFFACTVDYYIRNIYVGINSTIIKQLTLFVAISIILYICNQLVYNYAKEEESFMQHKIWRKMFIVIFAWTMISFLLFIFLYFVTPLEDFIAIHPWIIIIISYYFLFFYNLFVLSLVHIFVDTSVRMDKKISLTWVCSTLLIAIILFVIPSF
jgi:hypothetical protein